MLIGLKKNHCLHGKSREFIPKNLSRLKQTSNGPSVFFHSFHQSAGTVAIHDVLSSFSRRWFQICFIFIPREMIQFD